MALTQISTAGVKDDAVTSGKIPANAVGSSELADNAVDTNAIQDDAVTADKLANSINTEIAANTAKTTNATHTGDVTGSTSLTIANDAVTTAKIADNAVTRAQIVDGAINGAKCENQSIGAEKLTDGTIDNGDISASANIAGSKLADDSISLAKLQHGTSSNNGKFLRANNGADPTFETVSTDLVSDTSPQLGGNLASNGNEIVMADSDKIKCGTSDDLQIYHSGSHNIINGAAGQNLEIQTNAFRVHDQANNEAMIVANANGAIELYYDNVKKLNTNPGGIKVLGNIACDGDNQKLLLGAGDDFQLYHDGTNSHITNSTGYLLVHSVGGDSVIRSNNGVLLQPAGGENGVSALANGAVELYYNNSKKLETTSAGGTLTGTWTGAGKILQVIEARKTDKFATNSGSFVDISSLTVNITPSSSSNKILVRAVVSTGMGGGGIDGFLRLLRGSTALKIDQCTRMGSSEQNETIVLERLDTPNTTSQCTYKVQGRVTSNELFVNRDGSNDGLGESTIIVMEIAG